MTLTTNTDKHTINNSHHGFTLIEVLIAITVFAIGLLAINIMQVSSIRGNSAASNLSEQTNWVVDQIEKFGGLDYTDSALATGKTTYADGNITITTNDPIPNTKKITIDFISRSGQHNQFTWLKPEF